jgi:hypothetical protein
MATPEPDPKLDRPLPLQVVPHRRPASAAPSVFAPSGGRRETRVTQPLVLRWAAWSLSVVLAVPVVFLLTRQTGHDGAAPISPPAAEVLPTSDAAARYLAHLHNLDATEGYTFASFADESLVSIGTAACGALDGGATYDATRRSVMDQISNGGQVVLAAAATYLCPEHHSDLQNNTAQQTGDAPDTVTG